MKKTISVIVAIAMMLMVSIPAFAGNFDDNADLTAQQKVFAEVIFDGLNAGNNTADTLANYVGSNLDYKADVTSPATITDDVSEAFDAANKKLTVPFTDEALINSMKLRTSATITGRYQAANGEGSSNIGPGGSGSNVLDKLFPDFSNGDFSDLFKGFSDSFSQIGGAISGLPAASASAAARATTPRPPQRRHLPQSQALQNLRPLLSRRPVTLRYMQLQVLR